LPFLLVHCRLLACHL